MRIRVRLFAILRERAGRAELDLDLPEGATASDALAAVAADTGLGRIAEEMPLGFAINREYRDGAATLADGDELALIPPVSGGDAGHEARTDPRVHARIAAEPLEPGRLIESVGRPTAGAIVSFCGTTRDVARLDYEAYPEMAEERIREILAEAIERHSLEAAAAEHRVGAVPLGEPSVVVAAAAAHREQAFAGAREAIDRIKAEAPIWKREVSEDGARGERAEWVSGSRPPAA